MPNKSPPWNPNPGPGWRLLRQSEVTPEMTAWAIQVDTNSAQWPMHSTCVRQFGDLLVCARVEWHTVQARTGKAGLFRGVTLYSVPDEAHEEHDVQPETLPTVTITAEAPAVQAMVVQPADPPPDYALGVDVSHYQGPRINWATVAEGGWGYAYVKVTEGLTIVDDCAAANWAGTVAHGVRRGGYHFLRARNSGVAQARQFRAQLSKLEAASGVAELPPVLDVEVTDGQTPAKVIQEVEAFVNETLTWAPRVVIYCSPGFWDQLPGAEKIAAKCDLWVAHWTTKAQPMLPKGWSEWRWWQYDNKAEVPGIGKGMDVNRYNGTVDELASAFPLR